MWIDWRLGPENEFLIEKIGTVSPTFFSAYPNAGLPDALFRTGFRNTEHAPQFCSGLGTAV